jgi:predicted nuclease with RNAse H fold
MEPNRGSSPSLAPPLVTIGIDVGGRRKGFHAVALRDGAYAGQLASRDVEHLCRWCHGVMKAIVIAIDAPCRWSSDGKPRPCERDLLRQGIRCFTSPTRAQAIAHPTDYFGWMLRGEALFQALEATHPLLGALPINGPACFETFPHAITWHWRGGNANAAKKHPQRRELLIQLGLDPTPFTRIDWIDAALCALVAHQASCGEDCLAYGEPSTGLVVVPGRPLPTL